MRASDERRRVNGQDLRTSIGAQALITGIAAMLLGGVVLYPSGIRVAFALTALFTVVMLPSRMISLLFSCGAFALLVPAQIPVSWAPLIYAALIATPIAALAFVGKEKRLSVLAFVVLYGGHVCVMALLVLDPRIPDEAQALGIAALGLVAGLIGIAMSPSGRGDELNSSEQPAIQRSMKIGARTWVPALGIYLLGVGALIGSYIYMGGVPILDSSADNLDHARIDALRGTGFIRSFAYFSIVMPQSLAAVGAFLGDRRTFWCASGLLLISGSLHTGFGFRMPLLLGVAVPLVLWLRFGARRLTPRQVVATVLVLLGLVYFFGVYGSYRDGKLHASGQEILQSSATKFFGWESAVNLQRIARFFPEKEPYAMGAGYLRNISMWANPIRTMAGIPRVDEFGLWLKQVTSLGARGGGMSPTISGEAYVNFGLAGLPIVMLAFGYAWDRSMRYGWSFSKRSLLSRMIGFQLSLYLIGAIRTGLTTGLMGLGCASIAITVVMVTLRRAGIPPLTPSPLIVKWEGGR